MSNIEIDPFDAVASILRNVPPGPVYDSVTAKLSAPASRRDLLDVFTAQAHVNVTLTAALLAVWQHKDAELTDKIEQLLNQVQQIGTKVGELTARLLIEDDPYLRRPNGATK